ncbi:hypothetical protein [Marilutibacter maris]|uniref:hypothetical protein n=1 Tax=Marilutibacter maris TaxID=1605891 RepID=UPI000DA77CB0|nr:hypothetical protein [Lysobacter maris]
MKYLLCLLLISIGVSASDELSLGGIVLGQSEAAVIEALGPSGERVEGEADHLPVRLSWPGLTVRLDEQGVGSIVSTGSRYCTPSGACPGMSRAEVQHIYGARLETATMGGNPVGRVWDDGCWLGFLYDSGTVHAIEVGCVP